MVDRICESIPILVEASPEIKNADTGEIIRAASFVTEFVQRDRDATPEEQAEIDARRAAANDVNNIKASKIEQCDLYAKAKRDAVVLGTSAGEMASWSIKLSEALKYSASNQDSDAPNLAVEANYRGIPLAELVKKVLSKAAELSDLEAKIAGVNGRHIDAIKALSTTDEIKAYDITTGWPV